MANKLKLEDTCLTVEQAKELQKLGVDFSEPIHHFYRYIEEKGSRKRVGPWLIINEKVCQTCGMDSKSEFVPTLTNSEIMNMLPAKIFMNHITYSLCISKYDYYDIYYEIYNKDNKGMELYISESLLRDALFKMIKYLKTNKLI